MREDWVISPDNIIYHIKGLSPFCREFKLHRFRTKEVLSGNRQHFLGWYYFDISSGLPKEYVEKFY